MFSAGSSDTENPLLPLSQETFDQLCSDLNEKSFDKQAWSSPNFEELDYLNQPVPLDVLPTLTEFAGAFGFAIEIGSQPKLSKSSAWCYSAGLNRLYIQLHKPCRMAFRLSATKDSGHAEGVHKLSVEGALIIRATPVFSDYLQQPVERCANHLLEDACCVQCRHFIWADHPSTYYHSDVSSRYSTVVPFRCIGASDKINYPCCSASACQSVWYGYSFKCRSTCLNRKSVGAIFTLETSDGTILGRRVLEVKVCACPGRDMARDEKSQAVDAASQLSTHPASSHSFPLDNPVNRNHRSSLSNNVPSKQRSCAVPRVIEQCHRPKKKPSCMSRDSKSSASPGVAAASQSTVRVVSGSQDRSAKAGARLVPDMDIYCVFVKGRTNYNILSALNSHMSPGGVPFEFPVTCVDRDDTLNAGSTDSVCSDSDSLYSSGQTLQSKAISCSQLTGHIDGKNGQEKCVKSVILANRKSQGSHAIHARLPTVQEWLESLGLTPYTDDFRLAGYRTMADLKDMAQFSKTELRKLKIGAAHASVMWKSLKQWRMNV